MVYGCRFVKGQGRHPDRTPTPNSTRLDLPADSHLAACLLGNILETPPHHFGWHSWHGRRLSVPAVPSTRRAVPCGTRTAVTVEAASKAFWRREYALSLGLPGARPTGWAIGHRTRLGFRTRGVAPVLGTDQTVLFSQVAVGIAALVRQERGHFASARSLQQATLLGIGLAGTP